MVATVAIENLLVMKALAGRPQDEQDIRGLVAAKRETIDCPACLDLAEKLGEAVCLDLAGRACPCPLAGRSPRPFGQISGVGLPPSIKALDASRGTPRGSGSHRLCEPGSPNGPGIAEWTWDRRMDLGSPNGPGIAEWTWDRRMDRSPVACAPGFYWGHAKPEPTPGRRRRRERIPVAYAPGFFERVPSAFINSASSAESGGGFGLRRPRGADHVKREPELRACGARVISTTTT